MDKIIKFLSSNPAVVSAIVAAVTSLITLLLTILTKNFIEKRLLLFKLNAEHKFDQRKKIKNVLATNKSHLLRACEGLNHRLWNFSMSDKYRFLVINRDYKNVRHYYFHSFVYRILVVYAWMNKIQDELIHFDATIAGSDDLEFIKFMRFYNRIFTDTAFFKGFEYNDDKPTDHIYHNMFNELYKVVIDNNQVITFNEYLEKVPTIENKYLTLFFRILDGVNPNEKRLRWNWFQILKLLNISFLNAYGFDYQKTSDKKLIKAINTPKKSILEDNLVFLLTEHKLNNQKDIKHLIKLIRKS